ncbi:MAG: DUF4838 domain-containing protein [Armatimonadetes bacterium]|nr:DUF4838 domain-containing protein [Armatimonadota bacterium]
MSDERAAPLHDTETPLFQTRGVVLVVRDIETLDWPLRAKRAGLTTLGTHPFPHEIAAFLKTERGEQFVQECNELGVHVEHELHAMSDLLPRDLYGRDPAMFPMDEDGNRVRDFNLCVHSEMALEIVCENAVKYTGLLRSTTGRYFYWIDDGKLMCRCRKCRGLSDSDQSLLVENRMLGAIRQVEPRATLAHLVYSTTLSPPTQVKPAEGVFMEFAPISRVYDRPFGNREARMGSYPSHGELLDCLDANLEVFGRETAQVLEYWLDLSRFSGWKRDNLLPLPWRREVFVDDVNTYASRGLRHVTTFAAWLDGDYAARFGDPPVGEYGEGLMSPCSPSHYQQ